MSLDVELLVTFSGSEYSGISSLATKHLDAVNRDSQNGGCPEARAFLEEMAARRGSSDWGPKNGLIAWTFGGNYTKPDVFAEVLRPFWDDLLRFPVEGGPRSFSHVLIMYQLQDEERAGCLEIRLELSEAYYQTGPIVPDWPLVIVKHDPLPFSW